MTIVQRMPMEALGRKQKFIRMLLMITLAHLKSELE